MRSVSVRASLARSLTAFPSGRRPCTTCSDVDAARRAIRISHSCPRWTMPVPPFCSLPVCLSACLLAGMVREGR